jgi:hypothetical protein
MVLDIWFGSLCGYRRPYFTMFGAMGKGRGVNKWWGGERAYDNKCVYWKNRTAQIQALRQFPVRSITNTKKHIKK